MNAAILAMLVITLNSGGTLYVDGDRYRLEFPPRSEVVAHDTTISRDRDKTAIFVNHQNHTWFEGTAAGAHSLLLSSAAFYPSKLSDEIVTSSDEPTEEVIADHATKKHVIRLSFTTAYDWPGNVIVRVMTSATAIVNTAADLPPIARYEGIVTNSPAVNAKVAALYAGYGGMVLKQMISVSRRYEGGEPQHDLVNYEVARIETKTTDAALFEVPKGFVHQFPQIGAPGGSAKP